MPNQPLQQTAAALLLLRVQRLTSGRRGPLPTADAPFPGQIRHGITKNLPCWLALPRHVGRSRRGSRVRQPAGGSRPSSGRAPERPAAGVPKKPRFPKMPGRSPARSSSITSAATQRPADYRIVGSADSCSLGCGCPASFVTRARKSWRRRRESKARFVPSSSARFL